MTRRVPLVLALALGAGMAAICHAAPSGTAVAAGAVSTYRLRTEDVIEITVLGHTQLDKTVTILPDGTISYPRLGTIKAEGMTPQDLRQFLYRKLDRFYNNLEINVSVKALRTDRVTVNGAVKNPNIYEMRPNWTVRELLAAAGGILTPNGLPAPGQIRGVLIRKGGERIVLERDQLLSEPGAPALPTLEPDDALLVEDLTVLVYVEGQVAKPGLVTLPPGATVVDALRQAGLPADKDKAALSKAVIRRAGKTIPVNLRPFIDGDPGNASPPVMERNDELFIPENKNRILVWGGVRNPAAYALPEEEPTHITQALALAGGPVPRAGLKQVNLVQKVNGEWHRSIVNVQEIFDKGKLSGNIVVQPGDMIYVPDPKERSGFDPLRILQTAALFVGIF
jgi:protein involved in polysaccharide export with SLBB domain